VQAQLPFGGPETTVKMNNEWPINIPAGWDRNFDANSLEIVNETTNPVFQICYDSPAKIRVYGGGLIEDGIISVAFDGLASYSPGTPISSIPRVNPWFKYPSSTFFGKRSN
jgi:hypothetical protein